MNAGGTARHRNQVRIESVGVERSQRRHQTGHGLQACIQTLVCTQFVLRHTVAPETLAVQAYIPVRKVIDDEIFYQATGFGQVIVLITFVHGFHQGVEIGDDPAIYLGSL